MKKITALLLAFVLVLGLTACAEKKADAATTAATAEPAAATAEPVAEAAEPAADAPAVTLGSYTVTVGELESRYEYYMSYLTAYGMTAPTDPEEISEYVEMFVSSAISNLALPWQADEQGITLSEEETAAVEKEVEALRAEMLESYKDYAKQELGDTASEEALTKRAEEMLEEDCMAYNGTDFAAYLDEVREEYVSEKKEELLEQKCRAAVTLTEEDTTAWYTETVAADKTAVEADPFAYRTAVQAYEAGTAAVPGLYAPAGFVRVQMLHLTNDAAVAEVYAANQTQMTALEAEYGALALKGEDEARRTEIEESYAALTAANAKIDEVLLEKANAVLTEMQTSNMIFSGIVKKYDETLTEAQAENGYLLYTAGEDSAYPAALAAAAAALGDGDISEVIPVDGGYYILRRVKGMEEGAVSLEEIRAAAEQQALAAKQDSEWETVSADYVTAAGNAAVKYPDNYKNVGQAKG